MTIEELPNGYRISTADYMGRIFASIRADLWILLLIVVLNIVLVPIEAGIFTVSAVFSVYLIEVSIRKRFWLKEILFEEFHCSIAYFDFNKLKTGQFSYDSLEIYKDRTGIKTNAKVFCLKFIYLRKVLFKQYALGELDYDWMDKFVNKYQAVRSDRRTAS